jgi:hypothetical protein
MKGEQFARIGLEREGEMGIGFVHPLAGNRKRERETTHRGTTKHTKREEPGRHWKCQEQEGGLD